MAGNGPPPKANRRRTNADTYADVQTKVSVTADKLYGPSLLEAVGDVVICNWDEAALSLVEDWWDNWRRAPMAEAFLNTDWQRLTMLALLVADYFTHPHHMKLAEIRQNESLLGATHVDRLKARIKVERDAAPAETPPGVAALDDYRQRLAG